MAVRQVNGKARTGGGVGLTVSQIGALSLIVLAVLSFVPWWRTRRIIAAGGV